MTSRANAEPVAAARSRGKAKRTLRRAVKDMEGSLRQASIWRRYAFAWITGAFFLLTITGHWIFGWFAYVEEQRQHAEEVSVSGYVIEMSRDTLENWQSEFLQLLWQVGGLAFLLYVGSPQSREGDHRQEAKMDAILRAISPKDADKLIAEIDRRYDR
jgi:hypothetical protein